MEFSLSILHDEITLKGDIKAFQSFQSKNVDILREAAVCQSMKVLVEQKNKNKKKTYPSVEGASLPSFV